MENFLPVCAPGLEPFLAQELAELGVQVSRARQPTPALAPPGAPPPQSGGQGVPASAGASVNRRAAELRRIAKHPTSPLQGAQPRSAATLSPRDPAMADLPREGGG